jgi:hypothetical protein
MPLLLMRLITEVTTLDTSSMLLKCFPQSGFFNFGNKSKSGGLSPPDFDLYGTEYRFLQSNALIPEGLVGSLKSLLGTSWTRTSQSLVG